MYMLDLFHLMENIFRISVYSTVLKRMKPQLCFFLKNLLWLNITLASLGFRIYCPDV